MEGFDNNTLFIVPRHHGFRSHVSYWEPPCHQHRSPFFSTRSGLRVGPILKIFEVGSIVFEPNFSVLFGEQQVEVGTRDPVQLARKPSPPPPPVPTST